MELTLAQVNSGCAVDRHSQRAAWCPGRLVSALMFTPHKHSCLRVKCIENHTQDRGRLQVHLQTTREQLQQQKLYTYRLTLVNCPHLLSHEMTGQADSGALDQFLSSLHVVSYPAVVSCCSAELCFVLGQGGLRYRLRIPSNSEHSVFIGQYSNKRTTYHSATELLSRHTSHTVHEEIGTTFDTGLSETSHVQFASGNTLHCSL